MTATQETAMAAERFLVDAGGAGTAATIDRLRAGQRSFSWLNLASADLTVGRLLQGIRTTFHKVARTGHLGNWGTSAVTGSLDYNFILCGQTAVATPLIFDLNQTEQDDLQAGDTIYLPGSRVTDGRREPLELYAFDGTAFSAVSPAIPRFVPFLMTRGANGELVPLSWFHRRRLTALAAWRPAYQSSALVDNGGRTREFLVSVVEQILHEERAPRLWETLSDRTVSRDGTVRRRRSTAEKGSVQIGDETLTSATAIVDRLMRPLEIAADGDELEERLRAAPAELPLLSNHAVYALLVDALPAADLSREGGPPVLAHLQWGAIGLAGVPPVQPSYFDNNKKRVRSLFDLLTRSDSKARSHYLFVVLPGPPFLLFPRTDSPSDADVVNELCAAISPVLRGARGPRDSILSECEAVVRRVVGSPSQPRLSRYFAMRFKQFRSPLHGISGLPPSDVTMCDAALELSLAQASLLTGLLWKHFSAGEV